MARMVETRIVGERYEIVRKIAEGGMGAVFEARHTLSKKIVALKILLPHVGTDEGARARFLREVSVSATIGHDGIVEVTDAGYDKDAQSLFVAMEMLHGETLGARFTRGGLTTDQQLDLFERMLEPLAAAHAKGIVHRDLKPENVFLHKKRDGAEILKLLDFGIARDLDAASESVTSTGVAMGTPRYMAPEQAMSAKSVSFPADVWAVGVMMYEALAGMPPFTGETAQAIIVYTCTRPHVPLLEMTPGAPPAVAALVERCLAKTPGERPKDASALLADLRAARQMKGTGAQSAPARAPAAASGVDALATLAPTGRVSAPSAVSAPTPIAPSPQAQAAPSRAVETLQMAPTPAAPRSSRAGLVVALVGGLLLAGLAVVSAAVWALASMGDEPEVAAAPIAPPPVPVAPIAITPPPAPIVGAAYDDVEEDGDEEDDGTLEGDEEEETDDGTLEDEDEEEDDGTLEDDAEEEEEDEEEDEAP
jgi:hypothetical protein